jgi:hypothetical protein
MVMMVMMKKPRGKPCGMTWTAMKEEQEAAEEGGDGDEDDSRDVVARRRRRAAHRGVSVEPLRFRPSVRCSSGIGGPPPVHIDQRTTVDSTIHQTNGASPSFQLERGSPLELVPYMGNSDDNVVPRELALRKLQQLLRVNADAPKPGSFGQGWLCCHPARPGTATTSGETSRVGSRKGSCPTRLLLSSRSVTRHAG